MNERIVTMEQYRRWAPPSGCNAKLWRGKSAWINDDILPGLFGSSVRSYGYAQKIARPFYCWMHTSGHIRGRQHSFRLTRGQLQATFTWYGFANTWTLHETIRHFRVDMLRPHMRPFDLLTAVHHHQHTTHSPSPITTQHHSQPSPTTHYPPCNPPTTTHHQQHTAHHPNQPPQPPNNTE